ncbi:GrpB family protein [Streptomyces liangshanensis]|uniref:GrpB family protein n=2 Tax=Streptomyces liangshanensis TaxID=2717324 RepID=A0A6G9H8E8_9ACTN|nr:GrpB family protein [Streptomyces liangshanensis]
MAVTLAEYDPAWPLAFAEQRDRLAVLLAPRLAAPVEHIGSTAVPGLRAKPVVDVLAPVRSLDGEARAAMVAALSADGWLHWPDDPRADTRLWFLRPRPEARTHHLHVAVHGDARATSLLAFRDALRADPSAAAEYERLKSRLAREHPSARNAYTNGKAEFVARVLRAAGIPRPVLEELPESSE